MLLSNRESPSSMPSIPSKVESRLRDSIRRFQSIIEQARARDVGEADTSTLVKDMLAECFGYDKYSEITAEYQIKGTYCDLAIKLDGKLVLLVEVKAINLELKEAHIKQAVDYAANQGVEWVVLTNAQTWQVYRVNFGQPISHDLLMSISVQVVNTKSSTDLGGLFLLTREAHSKSLLDELHHQKQVLNRYTIGAVLVTEPVIAAVRRELRKLSPDSKFDPEDICRVLSDEVLKRDVIEGEKAEDAKRKVAKAITKAIRAKPDASVEPAPEGVALAANPGVQTLLAPPSASTAS